MKIIGVIYDDGNRKVFRHDEWLNVLFLEVALRHVETIVVGEVNEKTKAVIWEKQFSEVTVMSSEFGA